MTLRIVDLEAVEKLMELMGRHEIDRVAVGDIMLMKTRHRPAAVQVPDDASALAKHLEPLPNEPWNAIPQEEVDNWAEKAGG